MDRQQLKNVLYLHRKWVVGEDGGSRADLSRANLSGANLSGAYLSRANLSRADLSEANLSGADLSGADLSGADLLGANLSRANLSGAYLSRADLSGADLSGADLSRANLSRANLSGTDLSAIKEDFYKILDIAKDEALYLYDALMKGEVDGTTYSGECACLVGTIAKCRGEEYCSMTIELAPNSERLAEKWFLGISRGDLPQSNPISDVTAEWCREWFKAKEIKFPRYQIVAINE